MDVKHIHLQASSQKKCREKQFLLPNLSRCLSAAKQAIS